MGLGTNNFGRRLGPAAAAGVVEAALDLGVNLFDTADIYGDGDSERFLGQALRGRRDRAIIATKFGMPKSGLHPADRRGAPEYVRAAAEQSLRRLGVETIDLYQMHEPDPATPIEDTLAALQELVRAGKVRWIGVSNFSPGQLSAAVAAARALGIEELIAAQEQYNLLDRSIESELLPLIGNLGLGLLPYYPLASGLLTGKYRRGLPPPSGSRLSRPGALADQGVFDAVEALEEFARVRGVSLLSVAIGALLSRPQVSSVIAGATNPHQVAANCSAAGWLASADDWVELDRVPAALARS